LTFSLELREAFTGGRLVLKSISAWRWRAFCSGAGLWKLGGLALPEGGVLLLDGGAMAASRSVRASGSNDGLFSPLARATATSPAAGRGGK